MSDGPQQILESTADGIGAHAHAVGAALGKAPTWLYAGVATWRRYLPLLDQLRPYQRKMRLNDEKPELLIELTDFSSAAETA